MAKKLASVMTRTSRLADVRELVGEHALDLLRLEPLPEALGDRDGRVLRAPAGGERVRDVGRDDRHPRLRQVGHRAEALDHLVQLGRLARGSTTFAPEAARAILSDVKYWKNASPTTMSDHRDEARRSGR